MPIVNLLINGNRHAVSCNDGEEERLKSLANKFNAKLEQIAPSLKQIDDKTLYLITSLILLDEIDENKNITKNKSDTKPQQTELDAISNKILSIKQLLK